jgi:hypothetical protein
MVEAICVISVFILFFLGLVYFRSMYEQKLRGTRLARSAAVEYALAGCNGDPLASIQADLGTAQNNGSAQQQGSADTSKMTPNPNLGNTNGGGGGVGQALGNSGMVGDPIAGISVTAPAAGTTKTSALGQRIGFQSKVGADSYMSCGDPQADGTVQGALQYVKGMFKDVPF